MPLKLTPQNQLQRLYEDIERMNRGSRADFSLGQHIELLIKRVSALEASPRSDVLRKQGNAGDAS